MISALVLVVPFTSSFWVGIGTSIPTFCAWRDALTRRIKIAREDIYLLMIMFLNDVIRFTI
jgi:hypothetical protein